MDACRCAARALFLQVSFEECAAVGPTLHMAAAENPWPEWPQLRSANFKGCQLHDVHGERVHDKELAKLLLAVLGKCTKLEKVGLRPTPV